MGAQGDGGAAHQDHADRRIHAAALRGARRLRRLRRCARRPAAPTSTCPIPYGMTPLVLALYNRHFDTAARSDRAAAPTSISGIGGDAARCISRSSSTAFRTAAAAICRRSMTNTGLDVAQLLLERGANVNMRLKHQPPLRTRARRPRLRRRQPRRRSSSTPARRRCTRPPRRATSEAVRVAPASTAANVDRAQRLRHHAVPGGGRRRPLVRHVPRVPHDRALQDRRRRRRRR